ncbi:MAG: FG-GAP-like repeat-containing protein [Bacteroidota bacterium]
MTLVKYTWWVGLVALLLLSCESREQREERLAKTYCSSCHLFPKPGLLDKATWQAKVLPQMAFRMGIDASLLWEIPQADMPFVMASLPDRPMVSKEEWESIQNYFLRLAPDSLSIPSWSAQPLHQFEPVRVTLPQNRFPMLSLLHVDSASKTFFTSSRHNWLHQYNYQFQAVDSVPLRSPASAVLHAATQPVRILQMGIMDPNDQPKGSLVIRSGAGLQVQIDSLKRPVDVQETDLNRDGREDLIICAFGNYTGNLLAFENLGNGHYQQHVLSTLPGARKTEVRDFNNDGLPDVLAMITQGDEQITLFLNAGNFRFKQQTLLRFPAVYGSSYFETTDFNHDGHFDILYTNGDNADYSIALKPYHGVRIFLNDGRNQFKESWFFAMYGCSWAVARDFDRDGDVDVAAISFFPDFENTPENSFVYLENQNGTMLPFTTPLAAQGRWLLMETLDWDNDGFTDLMLGALNFNNGVPPPLVEKWKADPVSILLLKNKAKTILP